ncbi:hypothetical protein TA3x_002549 [Tundrisphaera sp. TA3]|uniref:hypothetical protein n=1 Tax=Tundrisphaera sp. TA3 TaxID=3435775 RepID=UPI003EBAAEE3
MSVATRMAEIRSGDRIVQGEAYQSLLAESEGPVDWAYEVWDDLLGALSHKDNRLRSIAAQLLCNLAMSDPEGRILRDLDALIGVTRDPKFVTARHCLLALWKVGLAGDAQAEAVVAAMAGRFADCVAEKNATLIRFDIVQGLRKLHDRRPDGAIRSKALELIESEPDGKYRKKYAGVWKDS